MPRSGDGPTLLLVRAHDGTLRSILTDGTRSGVSFPFQLPEPPGEGDNQAVAVNTGDGTVVYDVAVALVWVKDSEVVDNRNEAYALASCTSCKTVAVAFQVVGVIGQSDAIAPVNVAVAANGGCVRCATTRSPCSSSSPCGRCPARSCKRRSRRHWPASTGSSTWPTRTRR